MKADGQTARVIGGIAVLVLLLVAAILLLPPYIENFKLQQYLNDVSADPETAQRSPEAIRAEVVDKANQLGLPVHIDDVRVNKSGAGPTRIEVLYVVHVGASVYTVDLHFRPAT